MAILRTGILDGFRGKIGTVVGSIWKGICTMRVYVANPTNPNSPAQVEQRAKFSAMVHFLRPMTNFLRVGFKDLAIGQSAFNAAFSANFKNVIIGTYPAFDIDYSKVSVSQGNLPGALNPTTVSATAGVVQFTWEDNSWETDASADDQAVLVVYNPARQAAVSVVGGITRAVGSQTVTLPDSFAGDEVQCYIAFINANQSVISNSQYVRGLIVT